MSSGYFDDTTQRMEKCYVFLKLLFYVGVHGYHRCPMKLDNSYVE